jgi:cell fate regulator YaaT (PSP1 superfamily)
MSKDLERLNEDARRKAMERVRANGLGMKLSDAEWQWDRKKLTLYFTADKRVDFRNLVRDLASLFRTRIELKQIGVRDEAKRLDGIGRCGRQYCSASWLPELRPVNLGVAKDQRLSLNPSQISGACGRLMCCLRYEHDFYVQSRKRFPKEGKIVATRLGEEKVVSVDIFRERITLRGVEGETRFLTLVEFKDETEHALGDGVMVATEVDEESNSEAIRPDEISPELLYTAEHQVLTLPENVVPKPAPSPSAVREGDNPSRRRRGRRGGRRGRGEDSQSGNQ